MAFGGHSGIIRAHKLKSCNAKYYIRPTQIHIVSSNFDHIIR